MGPLLSLIYKKNLTLPNPMLNEISKRIELSDLAVNAGFTTVATLATVGFGWLTYQSGKLPFERTWRTIGNDNSFYTDCYHSLYAVT